MKVFYGLLAVSFVGFMFVVTKGTLLYIASSAPLADKVGWILNHTGNIIGVIVVSSILLLNARWMVFCVSAVRVLSQWRRQREAPGCWAFFTREATTKYTGMNE